MKYEKYQNESGESLKLSIEPLCGIESRPDSRYGNGPTQLSGYKQQPSPMYSIPRFSYNTPMTPLQKAYSTAESPLN